MQVPLQIALRDLPASEALEARIREKARKLEEFHPRITSCRVAIEPLPKHQRQGREFSVRVEVRVPGAEEIVSTLRHHEDVYAALRDAFDSAARQLEDAARRMRGDVKRHEAHAQGTVVRLFPADGCGFIEGGDGREFYFSRENVAQPFEHLSVGTPVQFLAEPASEGWQAKRVCVRKHETRVPAGEPG